MCEELNCMSELVKALHDEAFSNFPNSYNRVKVLYNDELKVIKVKLEELFSETDIKEQSMKDDFQ